APWRRKSARGRYGKPPRRSSPRSSPRRWHEKAVRPPPNGAASAEGRADRLRAALADLPRDTPPGRGSTPRGLDERVEEVGELAWALEHRRVARVEFDRLDGEDIPCEMALPLRPDHGVAGTDDVHGAFD